MTAHLTPSRRLLASGLAVAAGTAAVAAPAVAPPLAADPLDGDAELSPSVDGVSGTYESCTAMFGLTDKDNANYVTFTVGGTASPLPTIGDGLTPVATVVVDGESVECTPEVGFDDEASWQTYLGFPPDTPFEDALVQAVIPAPDGPGYLIPGGLKITEPPAVGPAAAEITSVSIRVEAAQPGVTVSSDPTELVFPEFDTEAFFDGILVELGGPESLAGARFVEFIGGDTQCSTPPSAGDEALATGLIDLVGLPDDLRELLEQDLSDAPCGIGISIGLLLLALEGVAPDLGSDVTVTATATPPGPSPTPGPEPVTPSFTG